VKGREEGRKKECTLGEKKKETHWSRWGGRGKKREKKEGGKTCSSMFDMNCGERGGDVNWKGGEIARRSL